MLQGVLVALAATLIYLESRIGGQHMIDRPIIIGPVVGLIMGDPVTGLVVGGQLELVWMGLAGIGTTTPPDVVTGSALGTALAIQTGASYETTLALAIPISLLAQFGAIAVPTVNAIFAHRADACAANRDYRGVERCLWMGTCVYFVMYFCMILAGFLVGSEVITRLVEMIPAVIQDGLAQSGNLLPAMGIAMLIQMTWDKKFGVFLFLGFALAAFLGVSTIGAAVFGAICAVIYFLFIGGNAASPELASATSSDFIDEDSEEL